MDALRRQLLEWLERSPRTYRETMDAWRTSCPRLSIWEDALGEGLIEVGRAAEGEPVRLTAKGQALLHAASEPSPAILRGLSPNA